MVKLVFSLVACFVIFIIGELGLRSSLFQYVSYSNSESIDRQLNDRNISSNWNMLFVGDSETRWGVDPREIDRAFHNHGIEAKSFNHAFDGFGASWWPLLLPGLLKQPELGKVEVVVLGVQLISSHRMMRTSGEDCGALQRPVLSSPFAIDLGIDKICQGDIDWDTKLAKKIFKDIWAVRYASSVRALILPAFMNRQSNQKLRFNSRRSGEPKNGFVPHYSIAQDYEIYEEEFARWKKQYVIRRDFIPMDPEVWIKLTSTSGFFDQLREVVQSTGRKIALFALPTNPTLIDTFNRREDYLKNSKLLKKWANRRNVAFVDLGIRDVPDHDDYFSDMRHLSGIGAKDFSRKLGERLFALGVFKQNKLR